MNVRQLIGNLLQVPMDVELNPLLVKLLAAELRSAYKELPKGKKTAKAVEGKRPYIRKVPLEQVIAKHKRTKAANKLKKMRDAKIEAIKESRKNFKPKKAVPFAPSDNETKRA